MASGELANDSMSIARSSPSPAWISAKRRISGRLTSLETSVKDCAACNSWIRGWSCNVVGMEMEAGQGRMKFQCHLTGRRLILLALAILAGCGRSGTDTAFDPSNASPDRILPRGNGPAPDSLAPQKAQATEAHTVLRDLCEGLTTLDKE